MSFSALNAGLFQPLRLRLQRGVNRLVYGERDDPYAVLARLGSRLEATLAPEKILSTIVETVAQAFKLPYVAIALTPEPQGLPAVTASRVHGRIAPGDQEREVVAFCGVSPADPVHLPLVYQGRDGWLPPAGGALR
ncbi:MAG TPA: hypothetical protein VGF67_00340 [Ktedonobacteraceae bacterium]